MRRVVHDRQPCLELRGSLPPRREGPPLHVHYLETEEGMILAGTLSAELAGRQFQVETGGTLLLPNGSPHRWWNAGDQPLEFVGTTRPVVDFDLYLDAAFEVLNSGPANRPSLFYMAHLAWRHRHTQAVFFAPRWLQPVLLPLLVGIGTILGRYHGTAWPGCPARCTAAPLFADNKNSAEPAAVSFA
jgi:hypothetical protein